jgi:hypothetical protein
MSRPLAIRLPLSRHISAYAERKIAAVYHPRGGGNARALNTSNARSGPTVGTTGRLARRVAVYRA